MKDEKLPRPDVIEAAKQLVADIVERVDVALAYDPAVIDALSMTFRTLIESINDRASMQAITGEHPRELDNAYSQSRLLQQIINVCSARKEQKARAEAW